MVMPNAYPALSVNTGNMLDSAVKAASARHTNVLTQAAKAKAAEATRLNQLRSQMGPVLQAAAQGDRGAIEQIATQIGPDYARKFTGLRSDFQSQDKAELEQRAAQLGQIGSLLVQIKKAPAVQQPAMYERARAYAVSDLGIPPERMPERYDPAFIDNSIAGTMTALEQIKEIREQDKAPETKKAYDASTGQLTFATDKDIASNPNLQPAPSGMEVVSDGKGGFTLRTGDIASSPGLTTRTEGTLEDKQIDTSDLLARTAAIQESFKPEYLQWFSEGGAADRLKLWAKDKAGVSLSEEEQQRFSEVTTFQRRTYEALSSYLNALSGAAISPEEAKRLMKVLPNEDDSPIQFKAKMDDVLRQSRIGLARYGLGRKYGLEMGVQITDSVYGKDGKPGAVDKIGEAVYAKLKEGGHSDQEAWDMAMQEIQTYFGGLQ